MRQWTRSALIQVMARRLFGAKPLPEPMLNYCQLDSWEQISVEFESEFYQFHSRKCIWNCRLAKWRSFCPGCKWVNNWYLEHYSWNILCCLLNMFMMLCQRWIRWCLGITQQSLNLHAPKVNSSPWTKWPPFRRPYFQMYFREWKVLYFDWNFT